MCSCKYSMQQQRKECGPDTLVVKFPCDATRSGSLPSSTLSLTFRVQPLLISPLPSHLERLLSLNDSVQRNNGVARRGREGRRGRGERGGRSGKARQESRRGRREEAMIGDRREQRKEGRAREEEKERRESLAVTNLAVASTDLSGTEIYLTVEAEVLGVHCQLLGFRIRRGIGFHTRNRIF